MKKTLQALFAAALVFSACDSQSPSEVQTRASDDSGLSPVVVADFSSASKNGDDVSPFLVAVNEQLAAAGANFAVAKAEYVTSPDGGEAGQTVFAFNRTLRLSSKWVPNDDRRLADGDNITYMSSQLLGLNFANGSIDSEPIVDATFGTYGSTACNALPLVKRPDPGVWPSAILALNGSPGDPFVADIVTLGFLPGSIFDLVLGPGASNNVLGVTFTYIFGSFDGGGNFTPSDVDNNGRTDTALKEVWYNDAFAWTDTGVGGIDIETVALHENGHALEMGHFGKVAVTGNGKLHVSPRAVMNAFILGVQRDLLGTDNASYCGNFASWPN